MITKISLTNQEINDNTVRKAHRERAHCDGEDEGGGALEDALVECSQHTHRGLSARGASEMHAMQSGAASIAQTTTQYRCTHN